MKKWIVGRPMFNVSAAMVAPLLSLVLEALHLV
jgi:hypothetical protein